MPKFVIEREIADLGGSSDMEFQAIAEKSCSVLRELGPDVQWLHSYVTADKMYCVYRAVREDLVSEHAHRGGFPAESIAKVVRVIDPTTAEA